MKVQSPTPMATLGNLGVCRAQLKNKAKGKRASSITLDQWIKSAQLTLN